MSVRWQFKVSFLWVFLTVAISAILILKPFSCNSRPNQIDPSLYTPILDSLSYVQADPIDSPILPDSSIPDEIITTTITGSGYWLPDEPVAAGDSVSVDVSVIVLEDESAWVKVSIDGKPAVFHKISHYHKRVRLPERDWTIFVEAANCGQSPIGVGGAYRIWKPLGINVSPAVAVSVNADWIAGEIRLSRNVWSGVALGIGCGYRTGGGLHISGGLSLEL